MQRTADNETGREPTSRLRTWVAVIAAFAVLYFGRGLLMPLALAMLLSFALGWPVARMERLGCGRAWSVGLVVGALTLLLTATFWMAGTQLQAVVDEMPRHRTAIKEKVGALVSRIAAVEAAGKALVPTAADVPVAGDEGRTPPAAAGASRATPLYTVAVDAGPSLLQRLSGALAAMLDPLGTAGMVCLFAVFMLLYREDLRNRLIRLVSRGDDTAATLAIHDASLRIGRFLGVQSLINVASGAVTAGGLFLLDVPGWALWGALYALLRFLPYVGAWIGASMPAAMALAASPGWSAFLAVCVFFVVLESIVNLVLEPWLLGESLGVSSFAVLIAAAFWAWIWGPIGLLLAMPLTAVLLVMGKTVPQMRFLHVLLGTDEVMPAADRFYQRTVANDLDEAMRILLEVADGQPLTQTVEPVLVAALVAAEHDRRWGKLNAENYASVCDNIRDALDEVDRREPVPAAASDAVARGRVLCLPVSAGAAEVAAAILASLLRRGGYAARAGTSDSTAAPRPEPVGDAETVCVVTLPEPSLRLLRAACRRVRAESADVRIVVVAWNDATEPSGLRHRTLVENADALATSVAGLPSAMTSPRRGASQPVPAPTSVTGSVPA